MKFRIFISPFFLSKLYLYQEIKSIIKKYKFKGTILDIGCGVKPYKNLFIDAKKYFGIDFKSFSINKEFLLEKPDYFFAENYLKTYKLPFDNESFDNTVSFQVLEHHANPNMLVNEMYRVTKKGGYLLLTVPFLGGIHEEPHDYQRYTEYGLRILFSKLDCKVIEIKPRGSVFSTISILLNEYLCDFVNKSKTNYVLGAIIYPPFILFQYVSLILDIFFKSKKIVIGYLILVKKGN